MDKIFDEGKFIAEELSKLVSLTSLRLDLGSTKISDGACKSIAQELPKLINLTLLEINLSGNNISKERDKKIRDTM